MFNISPDDLAVVSWTGIREPDVRHIGLRFWQGVASTFLYSSLFTNEW